ncbi:hypothetical protein [Candidatus Magnetomonas plexicatena]|uniref:hypothetical protein n=1 Tax=Candidatus Magnetomonas plexicatena TaxID=2552947 RepID=UPI001104C7C1|nr:hypothetical protein E2O03_008785 [Nitrospirales bacterium LBB_01]
MATATSRRYELDDVFYQKLEKISKHSVCRLRLIAKDGYAALLPSFEVSYEMQEFARCQTGKQLPKEIFCKL